MEPVVGIDLGTTFSAIAIVGLDRKAHAIPNAEGKLTTPSVAIWHEGAFLVGQPALDLVQSTEGAERERLAAALMRTMKQMIGNPPRGGLVSNGHRTTPVEVSAAILAKLARDASARLGFAVRAAVITVPAHFSDRDRKATKDAAEMAGLHVTHMINEPSAAALTYTHSEQPKPGLALVFDLGGGTFDATLLQLGNGTPRVLATKGIEGLGGTDFTYQLSLDLRRRYEAETRTSYPGESLSTDQLWIAAEAAKCALSDVQSTVVHLAPRSGKAIDLEVTRNQFTNLIDLYILQLQTAIEIAIERAGKAATDIDRVLLCGGSSRIPAIQEMLAQFFERRPEAVLDLDLSVALGAAYYAASSEQSNLQLAEGEIVIDCVSYPVGIAIRDPRDPRGELTKLLMLRPGDPLNTWSQSYLVRIVGAMHAFSPIAVYTGEGKRLDSKDRLGEIIIDFPPGIPDGTQADVMMRQDLDGLIQIQIAMNGRVFPGVLRRVAEQRLV